MNFTTFFGISLVPGSLIALAGIIAPPIGRSEDTGRLLMTIPILMVVLSLLLPVEAVRWTNIVVGSLFVLVSMGNAVGESWAFYWYGAVVESLLLGLAVRYAWVWRRR